jgi:hypothetical protein
MNRMTDGDDEARRNTALARREWHGVKLGKDDPEQNTAKPREILTDEGAMSVDDLISNLADRYVKDHPDPQIPAAVHMGMHGSRWHPYPLYQLLGLQGREALYANPELWLYVKASVEDKVNTTYERFWKLLKQPEVKALERQSQMKRVKQEYDRA